MPMSAILEPRRVFRVSIFHMADIQMSRSIGGHNRTSWPASCDNQTVSDHVPANWNKLLKNKESFLLYADQMACV